MSNYSLIIENIDLSHIHIAVHVLVFVSFKSKTDLNLQTKSYISSLLSSTKYNIFFRQNVVIPATLESGIDVGQGINGGSGKFYKKNKCRALNKRRAWKICQKGLNKHRKLENMHSPKKKFHN
jgi:hypothetical protein